MQKPLLLLAALLALVRPTYAADRTFHYGQWQCLVEGGVRFVPGAAQIAEATVYGFDIKQREPTADGVRYTGSVNGKACVVTYTFAGGRLHCHAEAQTGPDSRYALFVTFAGGDLADTTVLMDGQNVAIPAQRGQHEYQHATRFRFFGAQPERALGIDFPVCQFANLRDFRSDGRSDLQIMAFATDAGVIDAVFDMTTGEVEQGGGESSPGQRLVKDDDLHLPDLAKSRNFAQNPSFEGGRALWGTGVTDVRDPPRGVAGQDWGWRISAEPGQARTGRRSALYTVAKGYNPAMLCTWPIAVKTDATYTASFYARTDRPGAGVSLFSQSAVWPTWNDTRVQLTGEWKRYTLTFKAANPFLRLCFGDRWWDNTAGDQIDGAHIWLDDVQLEASGAATQFTQTPVFCTATTGQKDECLALSAKHKAVRVTLVNTSARAALCRADVRVQDWRRRALLRRTVQANLGPWAQTTQTIPLDGLQARGLLRVQMDVQSGASRNTFYSRLALYETVPDVGAVRYGLHIEQPTPDEARYRRPFGVGGSLGFGELDDPALVPQLQALNWRHIFSPTYTPGSPVNVGGQKMTEADWAAYDDWLGKQVAPYARQRDWKTINEPNVGGYLWTPAEVARAVGLMRTHIKAANPQAQVLSPDPYNASRGGQSWLEDFFKAGGSKVVDTVAIHTYRGRPETPDLDDDIQSLVSLKAKYGLAGAPLLFTEGEGVSPYSLPEIGMSPLSGFYEWRLDLLTPDVGRSELTSAALMTRTLLACLKNSDQVKFYLSWRDDMAQGQPWASLCAVNWLQARLRHARFQREYRLGDQTKTYVFQTPDTTPMAVFWSYDLKIDRGDAPPAQARVPIPGPGWRLFDFLGNPLTPQVAHGVWHFPVSGLPVYLRGPQGGSSALATALKRSTIGAGGLRTVGATTRPSEFLLRNHLGENP